MIFSRRLAAALFLLLSVGCSSLFANIEITLNNEFIEKYKDRATIDVNFIIDKALGSPHEIKNDGKDGELHIAGWADAVKLPIVAEIMNAASQQPAMDTIHNAEGTNQSVPLNGVWRLWCEHGGEDAQVQGQEPKPPRPFTTSNPKHVFEIHPIVSLNNVSILDSIHVMEGYEAYDAEHAFKDVYEKIQCHLTVTSKKQTTITTVMAGDNFAEFVLKPIEAPHQLVDGTGVLADVLTVDGELLVRRRRMVFIKDSPAEKALTALQPGQTMHVLGMPRISLKLVSWRRQHHTENERMLNWGLPYEMVILGIYPNSPTVDE